MIRYVPQWYYYYAGLADKVHVSAAISFLDAKGRHAAAEISLGKQ